MSISNLGYRYSMTMVLLNWIVCTFNKLRRGSMLKKFTVGDRTTTRDYFCLVVYSGFLDSLNRSTPISV